MNSAQLNDPQAKNLEVHAVGIDVVPAFRQYIEEKIDSLERIWPKIDDAHVRLLEVRGTHAAEITLISGGLITRGEMRAEDLRVAFDAAIDKLERQLRRYKKKAQSQERRHDNRNGMVVEHASATDTVTPTPDESDEDLYGTRVRTKRFAVKPMSPDEAALQMDLLGHNFFVFRDAESNEVSVVYKRRSGGYGLLEPVVD